MIPIAIVSRDPAEDLARGRFAGLAAALTEAGLAARPVVFDERRLQAFEAELKAMAAALVFVNPNQDGRRRTELDEALRRAARAGVVVSAHPDVIDMLGVKRVLARTAALGWSGDAHDVPTPEALRQGFPPRVAAGPRVLKPNRGNGGVGVWRVEAAGEGRVRVMAATGQRTWMDMSLDGFLDARGAEFEAADGFVDQAFQPRLGDGMIRCYFSDDRLAGFGWQQVRALLDDQPAPPRTYSDAGDPRFQTLRAQVEGVWLPGVQRILGLTPDALPAIWDADFLFGPRSATGDDSFVLCEVNASSVSPMPPSAYREIALTLTRRLAPAGRG